MSFEKLLMSQKAFKESLSNVLLLWDDGSEEYEPLEIAIRANQVNLAAYFKPLTVSF
jgi:hypothetical protein